MPSKAKTLCLVAAAICTNAWQEMPAWGPTPVWLPLRLRHFTRWKSCQAVWARLKTNVHAQVLDSAGVVISGLYAVGNDMNSVMGGHYPSGGITLGPGMTFGYVAARHIAGKQD